MTVTWRRAVVVVVAIAAAAVLLPATSTLPARFDVTPIAEAAVDRLLDAGTVALIGLGCDLGLTGGTGVAVSPGQVLTNRHVAERFRSLDAVYDGTPPESMTRQQIGVSATDDIAVVDARGLAVRPVALAVYDPRPGEPVWVAGYAHEQQGDALPSGLVVKAARVVDYLGGHDLGQRSRVMRVDVAVRAGMSGGPVLDQTGRLAGLIFAVDTKTNQGLVLPVSALWPTLTTALPPPAGC